MEEGVVHAITEVVQIASLDIPFTNRKDNESVVKFENE